MAGINSTNPTCNTHNALRNVTGYACGTTFTFRDAADPPAFGSNAVSAVEACCALARRSVMRIPGNTGCEMQFCDVQAAAATATATATATTGTHTSTATLWHYGEVTGASGTSLAFGPTTTVSVGDGGADEGVPPADVAACVAALTLEDLPDDVAGRVAAVDGWCVASMEDDSLAADQEAAAVTAGPSTTESTSTPESGASGGFGQGYGVWRVGSLQGLAVVSLLFAGLVVGL